MQESNIIWLIISFAGLVIILFNLFLSNYKENPSTALQSISLGFLISFITVITIQHLGNISGNIFHSPLGYDYFHITPVRNLSYITRFSIYIGATLSGFHYLLLFWVPISTIIFFFKKYYKKNIPG